MTLHHVQTEDYGQVSCVADNIVGRSQSSFTLIVHGK